MARSDRKLEYANSLLRKLLDDRELFFDGDYLNSEGRKLFEEASKALLEKLPWLKDRIRRIRRDPCFYRIASLYNDLEQF